MYTRKKASVSKASALVVTLSGLLFLPVVMTPKKRRLSGSDSSEYDVSERRGEAETGGTDRSLAILE